MILLCLVTSHAKAIQHPRSHRDLGRSKERSIPVTVRARNGLDFYSDSEITVACKAKGGKRIDETPFISFFVSVPLVFFAFESNWQLYNIVYVVLNVDNQ